MRFTLPQRASRHALIDEGAHVLAGSSPARRGIAVAAVVGGALSVAGAAVAVDRIPFPRDTAPDDLAAIGLAADGAQDDDADSSSGDSDQTPVLDTRAVADTVREASEEGKRLAEKTEKTEKSEKADDPRSAQFGRSGGPGRVRMQVRAVRMAAEGRFA